MASRQIWVWLVYFACGSAPGVFAQSSPSPLPMLGVFEPAAADSSARRAREAAEQRARQERANAESVEQARQQAQPGGVLYPADVERCRQGCSTKGDHGGLRACNLLKDREGDRDEFRRIARAWIFEYRQDTRHPISSAQERCGSDDAEGRRRFRVMQERIESSCGNLPSFLRVMRQVLNDAQAACARHYYNRALNQVRESSHGTATRSAPAVR